jgi:hypothetical protein
MVTTPYYVNGERVGSIGVLGPTRMPYPKVIALVEQIGQEVSNKMGGKDAAQKAQDAANAGEKQAADAVASVDSADSAAADK